MYPFGNCVAFHADGFPHTVNSYPSVLFFFFLRLCFRKFELRCLILGLVQALMHCFLSTLVENFRPFLLNCFVMNGAVLETKVNEVAIESERRID